MATLTNGSPALLGTNKLGPGMRSTRAEAEAARNRRRKDTRNTARLALADETDKLTTGEFKTDNKRGLKAAHYLPSSAASFFGVAVKGPDDNKTEIPSWFIVELARAASRKTEVPAKSPIQFEQNAKAAEANAKILKESNFNVSELIEKFSDTTLGYGSEFRTGMPYVFKTELTSTTKSAELRTLLKGNHKSATESADQLQKLLAKDVTHGFTIPIPVSILEQIPGAAVQPLGVVKQWTIDAHGNREIKYRMTQDLSFSSNQNGTATSINDRIDMSEYVEMIYGWCLPRILHYIVAVRLKFPTIRILISKYDYSDAYRRIAHSGEAAAQTIAVHNGMAYLSLRLTFGGSPNPPTWCLFSEIVTDLANEISRCKEWNPRELRNPAQSETPMPQRENESVAIATGRRMAVEVPMPESGPVGRVDGFIDDLINVFLDTPENCRSQPHVVPLAIHVTSRPHAGDDKEPIPRRPLLSLTKLIAEGSPAEVQIVLGWRLDTRRLLITLPDDKFRAWTGEIDDMTRKGYCRFQELDHNRIIRIQGEVNEDLRLWKTILARANQGVSLNLIVTREPDRICWSDACPVGLGGYSLSGQAWRIKIPRSSIIHGHKGVNNLLEFVGMIVNIWLECLDSNTNQSCILAIGDNTSAIGWLYKTSGLESSSMEHKAHLFAARHLATILMKYDCCIASQHIKGESNVVADLLSFAGNDNRDKTHPLAHDDPPNDILTQRFRENLTSQVPENFDICQLPSEILCWVTQVLRIAALSLEAARKGDTRKPTGSFLQCYRVSTWSTNGDVTGTRPRPLVASTVRQAAGHLAAAFRNDLRPSPIHVTGSSHLRPFIRALFRSYENDDPPRNQQRAITPKLLRAMYLTAGTSVEITRDTEFAIISELAIMAYFFAMRSCEFTLTPQTGRTRIVRLRGITFWDAKKRELPHRSPQITSATRVTITFEDQKNGVRMEKRTQRSTSDPVLCPVKRIRSLVERIYRRVPDANPDTSINATFLETVRSQITGSALRLFMRSTCTLKGGRPTFGFNAVDIGTRSSDQEQPWASS
ncbi:hypothetical protein MHU86_5415 [Fragilaria crotonensis]|nr:hypothetical protein MHU86_5415 [Fragilaria crotonensis]